MELERFGVISLDIREMMEIDGGLKWQEWGAILAGVAIILLCILM